MNKGSRFLPDRALLPTGPRTVCVLGLIAMGLWGCQNTPPVCSESNSALVGEMAVEIHDTMGSIVIATWEQSCEGESWLEYSFDADEWLQSPSKHRGVGAAEELALGVPFGSEVSLRLAWEGDSQESWSETVSIQTKVLPWAPANPEVLVADSGGWDSETRWVLLSLIEEEEDSVLEGEQGRPPGMWNLVMDRKGRTVWAMRVPLGRVSFHPRLSYDESAFLLDRNSFWSIYDNGRASQVLEVTIDGSVEKTYDTPGLHQPFLQISDGSLLWAATSEGWMDRLVKLSVDGEESTVWSCRALHEHLDVENYCAANTLSWNEEADTFLLSFYSTDSVVEIDHASGAATRWFGHLPQAWSFQPPESAFWWQHGVHYTPEGTLLLSTSDVEDAQETVVREYSLDDSTETLVEIWNFGLGDGILADEMGEVRRLGNGNIFHNYGTTPRLREASPEGQVVWDVSWEAQRLGNTVPLSDLYRFMP
ncbi:MAG: hypothetical protein VX519_08495 [Myxococcota bacterium]|nr:hypothetical protein [Myxococcota bacterium]